MKIRLLSLLRIMAQKNMLMSVLKTYNHNSSNPFRGVKRDVYEGGHHVPFIVKWPNKIKSGDKSSII